MFIRCLTVSRKPQAYTSCAVAFFRRYIPITYNAGLLASAAEHGATLSRLLRGYEPLPQLERSVPVRDREAAFCKELLLFCDAVSAEENCARIVVRPSGTEACVPARGEILLRRIKASLLKQWKMQFDTELNGGSFTAECRYDGGPFRKIRLAEWETVPENAEYLFFRLRMERAEKSGLSPFVHNLELFVREK